MTRNTHYLPALILTGALFSLSVPTAVAAPLAGPQDSDSQLAPSEIGRFDMFLDMHPDIAGALANNPALIDNAKYVRSHPALMAFLTDHTQLREALRADPARVMGAEKHFDVAEEKSATGSAFAGISKDSLSRFDSFLDSNPAIESDLEKNPALVNDPSYLKNHPELQQYLESHPSVAQSVQTKPATFMAAERFNDLSGRDITNGEVTTLDGFLDTHPAIAQDLAANPSLITDPAYMAKHPEIQGMLSKNPGIQEEATENPQMLVAKVAQYDRIDGDSGAIPPSAIAVSHERSDASLGAVASFDAFLDRHPDMTEQLRAHPELIASAQFRSSNPELKTFLSVHPAVARQLAQSPAAFMSKLKTFDQHETPAVERQEQKTIRRTAATVKPGSK